MLRVELHNQDGVVGEVNVVAGVATPSNDLARRTMQETKVVLPGPKPVRPENGEEYLRGLARCLDGTYFWAELKQG
jgi:hypothetical protein